MPEADVLIDSVVLTLYCSKEVGSGSFGACTKVRLPVPEIFTVTVAPELAAIRSEGNWVFIVKLPTAPLKLAGAPAGSAFTWTVARWLCTLRGTLNTSRPPPKKGSAWRLCTTTCATTVMSTGSIVSEPTCCG